MGIFITFEGVEGCGKTSVINRIHDLLKETGTPILLTREPGGVEIAEQIRNILLDNKNTNMDARCEAILYAASRRQHLTERIIPFLHQEGIVLCDRYLDSSLAYQGYARGLGIEDVFDLNRFAIEDYLPDLTLLFDIDPEIGLKRVHSDDDREVNRLDNEAISFHRKVREGFLILAEMFPDRYAIIDASQSLEEVTNNVYQIITEYLKRC